MRSARTSDIAIFSTLHRPFYAWSGANPTFAASGPRGAAIKDVGYDVLSGEYFREPSRPRPENLMLKSTATIMAHAERGRPARRRRCSPTAPTRRARRRTCEPVDGVHITYGGGAGRRARRVPLERHGLGAVPERHAPRRRTAGQQVAPENVIIQFVNYVPTDVADQFGVPIPEAQLVGQGEAWVLTDGGIVKGGWIKPSVGRGHPLHQHRRRTRSSSPRATPGSPCPPPGGASRL